MLAIVRKRVLLRDGKVELEWDIEGDGTEKTFTDVQGTLDFLGNKGIKYVSNYSTRTSRSIGSKEIIVLGHSWQIIFYDAPQMLIDFQYSKP